jgi:hypothetical protein
VCDGWVDRRGYKKEHTAMEYKRREGLQKEGVIEYVKYC